MHVPTPMRSTSLRILASGPCRCSYSDANCVNG